MARKKLFYLSIFIVFLFMVTGGLWFYLQPTPGRTNFLILGMAGKGYAGEDLTDTILYASIENQTGKTTLVSLPRDIWIPAWRTKLNSIYHYKGLTETKKTVGEITGQPINYGVIIDFEIFQKIINYLGGVEINIDRSFDDYQYPLAGKENDLCAGDPEYKCRFEHLHFDAGRQYLNGERALKYIRSRNAEGEEGTDFSRSQRQQKLVQAVVAKITLPSYFLQPRKIWGLFKLAQQNIKTDIDRANYLDLIKIGLRFNQQNLHSFSLNGNFFINPKTNAQLYDNQWVLIPKSGDWQEVKNRLNSL